MSPGRIVALLVAALTWGVAAMLLVQDHTAAGWNCGSVISPNRPTTDSGIADEFGFDQSFLSMMQGATEEASDRCDEQRITRVMWVVVLGLFGVGAAVIVVRGSPLASGTTVPGAPAPPPGAGPPPVGGPPPPPAPPGPPSGPPTSPAPQPAPEPDPAAVWGPPGGSAPLFPGTRDDPYRPPS